MAVVPTQHLPALSQRMAELSESEAAYPDCETSTAKALVDLLIENSPVPLPFEVVVVAGLEPTTKRRCMLPVCVSKDKIPWLAVF